MTTTPTIRVRPAQETDADVISSLSAEIQALHAQALPQLFKPAARDSFPAAAVRGLLQHPDWIFIVACVDTSVVGYASAQIQHRSETPIRRAESALFIHWIGVQADWRRQGVGRALIDAIRNAAERHGLGALLLDVWAFNADACAFYEAMGFHPQRQILSLDLNGA